MHYQDLHTTRNRLFYPPIVFYHILVLKFCDKASPAYLSFTLISCACLSCAVVIRRICSFLLRRNLDSKLRCSLRPRRPVKRRVIGGSSNCSGVSRCFLEGEASSAMPGLYIPEVRVSSGSVIVWCIAGSENPDGMTARCIVGAVTVSRTSGRCVPVIGTSSWSLSTNQITSCSNFSDFLFPENAHLTFITAEVLFWCILALPRGYSNRAVLEELPCSSRSEFAAPCRVIATLESSKK